MNIFVAKLNFDTQEDYLREVFEEYGEVTSASVITDKFTGKSKGYAFVEMPNDSEAEKAIAELNDSEIDGRTILVAIDQLPKSGENFGHGQSAFFHAIEELDGAIQVGSLLGIGDHLRHDALLLSFDRSLRHPENRDIRDELVGKKQEPF